jgi:nicotinate phosphoribosyltransferase
MRAEDRKFAEGILYTDQYQLTMAQLYYRMGIHETPVLFEHFFRSYPDYGFHKAGYCINAGLAWLLNWMTEANFGDNEIAFLKSQKSSSGSALFDNDFLQWLRKHGDFRGISLRAIPEGRVVHPNVPLTVVKGPFALAQIFETPLLNHLNYQSLVATKAARIRQAGRGQLMLEFGLRRGQDRGANAGARAALIGGADFSSNVGISQVMGLPPKGTHAHSMVQAFIALGEDELAAFQAYADVYPDDCLLLVDTIDTLESGLPNAIRVFEGLKKKGHKPIGIRLDSGDLAYLSIQASKMLDKAGFPDTRIVLSNQLDELVLWQIISQIEEEAPLYDVDADQLIKRLVYGVGTRLITSRGQSALDGVYKLVAVCMGSLWKPAIKLSDSIEKVINPGHKNVWRLYNLRGMAEVDLISLKDEQISDLDPLILHHPTLPMTSRALAQHMIGSIEPLLEDVLVEGKLVVELPSLEAMRQTRQADFERLDPGVRRIMNPHIYHVSVTDCLQQLKRGLIAALDSKSSA